MDKDYLVLKRASASRPSGEWNDDDFDVLTDGAVVGRIMKVQAASVGSPWMWRWPPGIMRTARQRTATQQRARPRWPHSRRAGGGSDGPCTTSRSPGGISSVDRAWGTGARRKMAACTA